MGCHRPTGWIRKGLSGEANGARRARGLEREKTCAKKGTDPWAQEKQEKRSAERLGKTTKKMNVSREPGRGAEGEGYEEEMSRP